MDIEKVILSSKTVELSENKTHLLLVDRVCYYDYPNLNGVKLPLGGALEAAQTLVGMPVYAKYAVNSQGLPTFKGHEAYIDADGDIAFATDMIGTHLSVEIKDDLVDVGNELKTLPCLFATLKIPTRKKNVIAAVKRLYSEGKLHNSWEITSSEYSYENNIKTLKTYEYEGNTLLGFEYASPAYGESAKVISLSQAQKENSLMIAEAVSQDLLLDIQKNTKKEDNDLEKTKGVEPVVNDNTNIPDGDASTSAKSTPDGASKDNPTAPDSTDIKMTISITQATEEIEKRDKALIFANSKIEELEAEIKKLIPFKEAHEKAEAEKAEAEKVSKIAELKEYVKNANCFTDEEIESEEILDLISGLKKAELQSMIADRIISNLSAKESEKEKTSKSTETAIEKVSLVAEDTSIDYMSVMNDFFKK